MHCIQRGIYLDADVKDFRCFDEILDWDFFSSKHFIKEDGSLYTDIINPGIMATIATKYGFVYALYCSRHECCS